jgi:hypothetical protein
MKKSGKNDLYEKSLGNNRDNLGGNVTICYFLPPHHRYNRKTHKP